MRPAQGRKRRPDAAPSTGRSTAGSCGQRRCSCSAPPAPARAHDRATRPASRLDAPALVRRPLRRGARDRARPSTTPSASARLGRRSRSRPVGEGQARPLRPHRRRGQLGREHPRSRPRPAAEPRHGRPAARRTTRSSSLAHRDDTGVGPGANDNASGTAALIELARGYGRLGTVAGRPTPQHTLIFLSSDGGAYGGFGAERFASTSPYRDRIKAVVSLDGLAGSARAAARDRRLRATLAGPGA